MSSRLIHHSVDTKLSDVFRTGLTAIPLEVTEVVIEGEFNLELWWAGVKGVVYPYPDRGEYRVILA